MVYKTKDKKTYTDLVLGVADEARGGVKELYAHDDFDPYDPMSKYNE